jgi:hypothetical protein
VVSFYDFDPLVPGVSLMQVLRMLGDDEVIVLPVDEESRDEGLLDVVNWIQFFDVEVMLDMQGFTLSLMVDLMKDKAIPLKIDSPPPCRSANSRESFSRFEKGESRTTQPISWLVSEYIRAVTAPILLPQIPILLTVPRFRKYLKTQSTSSLS